MRRRRWWGRAVPEELPPNTYLEYYAPDHRLNLHSKYAWVNLAGLTAFYRFTGIKVLEELPLKHVPRVIRAQKLPEPALQVSEGPVRDHSKDLEVLGEQYAPNHCLSFRVMCL